MSVADGSTPLVAKSTAHAMKDRQHFPAGSIGPGWLHQLASRLNQWESSRCVSKDTRAERPSKDASSSSPSSSSSSSSAPNVKLMLEFGCQISKIEETKEDSKSGTARERSSAYPLQVTLTNAKHYSCDYVVSATGVVPNTDYLGWTDDNTPVPSTEWSRGGAASARAAPEGDTAAGPGIEGSFECRAGIFHLHSDGGVMTSPALEALGRWPGKGVAQGMRQEQGPEAKDKSKTSSGQSKSPSLSVIPNVFVAGDCAHTTFDFSYEEDAEHWFQMRLWSQARRMGIYAARAMAGEVDELGFNFCLFAHATKFFGQQVALFGRYNGQGLEDAAKAGELKVCC